MVKVRISWIFISQPNDQIKHVYDKWFETGEADAANPGILRFEVNSWMKTKTGWLTLLVFGLFVWKCISFFS